MNFLHLANNCAEYGKDKLTAEDAKYISGMEYVRDEVLDDYLMNNHPEDADETILERVKREIAEEVVSNLKDYISVSIAEAQVSLIDIAVDVDEY